MKWKIIWSLLIVLNVIAAFGGGMLGTINLLLAVAAVFMLYKEFTNG